MVGAWHGHGMASVNQTRPHCVNQIGNTYYKLFGLGMAGGRQGHGMICVNRPLMSRGSLTKMSRNPKFQDLHAYLRAYGDHAVTKRPYITVFIGNKIVSIKSCRE